MPERALGAMVSYFGADARRVNHALKVYGFSRLIAAGEGFDPETTLGLSVAAALHDIGIPEAERKHGSSAGNWQELEGPPVASRLLAPLGYPAPLVDRVLFLIGHHHSYSKIDGPDFRALVEADFLVNAFEDAMEASALRAARERVFRTPTGLRLLSGLYPALDA